MTMKSLLHSLVKALKSPGARREIHAAAQTATTAHTEPLGYTISQKERRLDRWLDWTVSVAGSPLVFTLICGLLLVWALLGIRFHADATWQVLISDVQAIVSYIFDSFLMRQQLNGYEQRVRIAVELQSRAATHKRILESLAVRGDEKEKSQDIQNVCISTDASFDDELPAETFFGALSTLLAKVLGHAVSLALYWLGILVWLVFGHHCSWSNAWQLYINSATSALMLFVFSFLANIHERHAEYEARALDAIYRLDSTLECTLRTYDNNHSSDKEKHNQILPNPVMTSHPPKVNILQRAINYYAEVVGTLTGILLLVVMIVVWIIIGPAMSFDSNWWLIIGTYAGLVGMHDGFVLRNVQEVMHRHEESEYSLVKAQDQHLLQLVERSRTALTTSSIVTSTTTGSNAGNRPGSPAISLDVICAHEITVLAGLFLIIGLLVGAGVMHWNLTGQLLCNVPPSIIETFFMILLISAHSHADEKRRADLRTIYRTRLHLLGQSD
ncbi:hypothetical protein ASPZODRAFT_149640 [Penicilliopsis zonata CBS 506.65]|uniref:Low affinity iron permease n=1 Tax=Penicilliopsis zonata CBS 506.65 TaxID=1073090 RepID=A0A1L9SSW1_9EURO|nr:hypothetical protein ASPZODRAFT_149640 [Penicilliopsis zonata CBS 506.65]OJJ50279.1 hypothetical protein ASPZODRAFT_149640 [Penicilliopsis zonata CBS 506.65]